MDIPENRVGGSKGRKPSVPDLSQRIRSALRQVWSYYDPNKKNAKLAARRYVPRPGSKSKRLYIMSECNRCKALFPESETHVDHIVPIGVTPALTDSPTAWGEWLTRVFTPLDNLQVLCMPCHAIKTKEEAGERKLRRQRKATKSDTDHGIELGPTKDG